ILCHAWHSCYVEDACVVQLLIIIAFIGIFTIRVKMCINVKVWFRRTFDAVFRRIACVSKM
ncbi:MAG: hypothetical protein IJ619_13200, partial [Eubacterium sp.]|nr:hypothetical protein [Eubacterium sp.]